MPHIHEKIDFTASVLLVNDSKVLLRMHDKYNIWLGIGGHIELDEDPLQALYREVKEESGLEFELIGRQPRDYMKTDTLICRFLYSLAVTGYLQLTNTST